NLNHEIYVSINDGAKGLNYEVLAIDDSTDSIAAHLNVDAGELILNDKLNLIYSATQYDDTYDLITINATTNTFQVVGLHVVQFYNYGPSRELSQGFVYGTDGGTFNEKRTVGVSYTTAVP